MSYDLGKSLISLIPNSPDSQTILLEMASLVGEAFPVDVCLIVAGIQPEDNLQAAFWNSRQASVLNDYSAKQFLRQPYIRQMAAQKEPTAIADGQILFNGGNSREIKEIGDLESLLLLGTRFRSKVNGIILLGKINSHQWTTQEQNLFKEVANIVAIACSLAQLENRESTSTPNALPSFLKTWYDATRNRLEQQQRTNEQLSEQLNHLIHNIITIMSDQTRNPLANMKMAIKMLKTTQLEAKQEQRLDILEKEWSKLNDINEKILQFKDLRANDLNFSPTDFDFTQLLKEITQPFKEKWQQDERRLLKLEVEISRNNLLQENSSLPLILHSDPEHLRKILTELLTNAGKFSLPKTNISVQVKEIKILDIPSVSIAVTNLSHCIPQDNLKSLFEPFYRQPEVINNTPGIGLGLTTTQELVQLLQGKIKVTCTPIEDPQQCMISFELILPQFSS